MCRVFYDELADDYDAIYADWDASVRRQAREILLPLLGEADPILDVAAGMGTQAIGLALAGRRVVARDLSPRLVERGRGEAARLGAEPLRYEVGDMRQARPEDAGRFGAVIAFDNALPHLLDDAALGEALAAAHAALTPGGRFAASLRDYDALSVERPALDPPRLLGEPPARRLILQVWTWADDGESYALDHLILRERDLWRGQARSTRYRALRRAVLEKAARAAGFIEPAWRAPAETGFYQPIFTARRP